MPDKVDEKTQSYLLAGQRKWDVGKEAGRCPIFILTLEVTFNQKLCVLLDKSRQELTILILGCLAGAVR